MDTPFHKLFGVISEGLGDPDMSHAIGDVVRADMVEPPVERLLDTGVEEKVIIRIVGPGTVVRLIRVLGVVQ
jgi:hypothetical protein